MFKCGLKQYLYITVPHKFVHTISMHSKYKNNEHIHGHRRTFIYTNEMKKRWSEKKTEI